VSRIDEMDIAAAVHLGDDAVRGSAHDAKSVFNPFCTQGFNHCLSGFHLCHKLPRGL
jgi:hypothetical protein